jgi:hypothetical protein
MIVLKYIGSFLASLLSLQIVYFLFSLIVIWFINLSTFWMFMVLFFAGTLIWNLFLAASILIIKFCVSICNDKKFSFYTILILSVYNCLLTLYQSWTMDIDYNFKICLASFFLSILIIEVTVAIIMGAYMSTD